MVAVILIFSHMFRAFLSFSFPKVMCYYNMNFWYNINLFLLTDQVMPDHIFTRSQHFYLLFQKSCGTITTNLFQTKLMNLSNQENSKMSGISHLLLVPPRIRHLQLQWPITTKLDINFYYQLARHSEGKKIL